MTLKAITDADHIRERLGRLLEISERVETDISEIKVDNKARTVFETETRRRVDRNTTFARGIAWAGGTVFAGIMAVLGWEKMP